MNFPKEKNNCKHKLKLREKSTLRNHYLINKIILFLIILSMRKLIQKQRNKVSFGKILKNITHFGLFCNMVARMLKKSIKLTYFSIIDKISIK